jgi:hypothetical protein
MGRIDNSQFNIRSAFARKRARALAEESGMTVTQVVEEALRSYVPPPSDIKPVGRLVRRGRLLVMPANGQRKFTLEEINAAIEEDRNRDLFVDGDE